MALSLTSQAFDDGDPIPAADGYRERDVNPPPAFEGADVESATLGGTSSP